MGKEGRGRGTGQEGRVSRERRRRGRKGEGRSKEERIRGEGGIEN